MKNEITTAIVSLQTALNNLQDAFEMIEAANDAQKTIKVDSGDEDFRKFLSAIVSAQNYGSNAMDALMRATAELAASGAMDAEEEPKETEAK